MSALRSYVRRFSLPFLGALAFLSIESVCDLLQPALLARVIDEGVANRDGAVALAWSLAMVAVAAVGAVGAIGRNVVASRVSYRFARELRSSFFRAVLSMDAATQDRFDAGSLVTRQTNDVTQVQNFVTGLMRIFAKAPIVCVGALVMSFVIDPRLAVLPAIVVPLVVLIILASMRLGYPAFARVQSALEAVNSSTRSFLESVRPVKAFGREAIEREAFDERSGALADATTAAARLLALLGPLSGLVVNLGIVGALWAGGWSAENGGTRIGSIIAIVNYMTQISFALFILNNVFQSFVRARASWRRVDEVISAGTPRDGADGRAARGTGGDAFDVPGPFPEVAALGIEFREVSFSYPGGSRSALERVSFSCARGEILAVIGSSGSGKSTIARLATRSYEPSSGEILVDGARLSDVPVATVRAAVGVAPQSASLFSGTVADNLRQGREDATDGELREAASLALADEFLDAFPEGYLTRLGRGGVNLSGGQRQRLSLARALVREPRVLVLDDCTSAVDAVTEARIRENLRASLSHAACVWITQRVATASRADRVLVLEDGRVAGFGTHAELVANCPVYAEILDSQSEGVAR